MLRPSLRPITFAHGVNTTIEGTPNSATERSHGKAVAFRHGGASDHHPVGPQDFLPAQHILFLTGGYPHLLP